jgi:hypothetical protein
MRITMPSSRITSMLTFVGLIIAGPELVAGQGPRVVNIKAYDYRFEAPARVPAGTITFRMENAGKEIHHLWMVKLTNKKTPGRTCSCVGCHRPTARCT